MMTVLVLLAAIRMAGAMPGNQAAGFVVRLKPQLMANNHAL